jgi:MipA family protein
MATAACAQDATALAPPTPVETAASAPAVAADDASQPEASKEATPPRWGYVLGASLGYSPPYPGAGFSKANLRPLFAVQYGRFRISTSRASAILGFGVDAAGPGVSADLLDSKRWRAGLALRVDSGRKSADAPRLTGLPDIDPTLIGRAYTSYALTDRWSLSATLAQDLLNKGGGTTFSQGLGYRAPFKLLGQHTEWTTGVGATYANSERLKTRYGITPEQSAITGLPAFTPRAGYSDVGFGVGLTSTIGPSWVVFANTSWSRLTGDAALSPLTLKSQSQFTSIGLAYRCCR